MLRRMVEIDRICVRTHAEYVRVRLVGSGLGSSPGFMGLLSLSQTRLPSLKKGKESCRGVRGDVRGSRGSVGSEEPASDILTRWRLGGYRGTGRSGAWRITPPAWHERLSQREVQTAASSRWWNEVSTPCREGVSHRKAWSEICWTLSTGSHFDWYHCRWCKNIK